MIESVTAASASHLHCVSPDVTVWLKPGSFVNYLCRFSNSYIWHITILQNKVITVTPLRKQHFANIECRCLIVKDLPGAKRNIQERHVICIRWNKIHSICNFSAHTLPNVCTSQVDHNTKMTFSNTLLCKLCCNSMQTKLCQRTAPLILHLTAFAFILVPVIHVRITQQASALIDSFHLFSSRKK